MFLLSTDLLILTVELIKQHTFFTLLIEQAAVAVLLNACVRAARCIERDYD